MIDLDGTLIRGNSLHLFMLWSLCKLSLCNVIKLLSLGFKRMIGISSHVEMKSGVLKLARDYISDRNMDDFLKTLSKKINLCVLSLTEKYDFTILATAAPGLYADRLASGLGFDICLSSDTDDIIYKYKENRGKEKLKKVMDVVNARNLAIKAVVTDHIDDLPLLEFENIKRYIVNPDDKLLHALNKISLSYEIL